MFETVKNGAIVVAHCDDETMWFGGLISRIPDTWTVIACSIPRVDPIRAYKFFDACKVLGAFPRLIPVVETSPDSDLDGFQSYLDLSSYDCVVTHNENGEYGHRHHRSVHNFVKERARETWTVGYGTRRDIEKKLHLVGGMKTKIDALKCYNHVSPSDGKPKWQALIERYSPMFDLGIETYARA